MTGFYLIRGFFILLFSGLFAWLILTKCDADAGFEGNRSSQPKYAAIINGTLLPIFLISLLASGIPLYGFRKAVEIVLPPFFSIFLHISLYYLVLMIIMPLLHRYISSRTCAMLWIVPNYLYFLIHPSMELNRPLFVIHISHKLMYILLALWAAGFLFVLMGAFVQHFKFRRAVLKSASSVTDPEVLEIWQTELTDARIRKPKYRLLVSDAVHTPLSFGMTNRSTRVVLPVKTYTKEELALIFRHEIIHICRCDSVNKFFLTFCCAMCWFNPLMWIAMRKSAEDMELSCDESVLLEASDDTRKKYANLILSTAGDGRGFTTCLSASAAALRYRLQAVVKTGRKHTGALFVAILTCILIMTCGFTAISYGDFTFDEVVQESLGGNYTIDAYNTSLLSNKYPIECCDEEAMKAYLATLPLQKVSGNYSFSEYENYVWYFIDAGEKSYYIDLNDHGMKIVQLGVNSRSETYIVNAQIDWDYLESLLYVNYLDNEELPFPPTMTLTTPYEYLICSGSVVNYTLRGEEQPKKSWWDHGPVTDYINPQSGNCKIQFSHDYSGIYTVEIDYLNGNVTIISSDEMEDPEILQLMQQDANYTIRATFEDAVTRIEMFYTFAVRFTE